MRGLLIGCAVLLMNWGSTATAAEVTVGTPPPALDSVIWTGQRVNFEMLKGKTVVVLMYATWCPKCNTWSPTLLQQVHEAMEDKPVVTLAIVSDVPPAKGQQYMMQRKFTGPNIFYGFDPTLHRRFGRESDLFEYAIINPEGIITVLGSAGITYVSQNGDKTYSIAHDLKRADDLGAFRFINENMSDSLKRAIFPMELGLFPSLSDMRKMKKNLKPADRETLDDLIETFLDEQLAAVESQAEGKVPDRLQALETATFLSTTFRSTEQGKQARRLMGELNKDRLLKKEAAARKLYDQCLQQSAGDPEKQADLMKSVVRKFPGTYYARLAGEEQEEVAGGEQVEGKKAGSESKTGTD